MILFFLIILFLSVNLSKQFFLLIDEHEYYCVSKHLSANHNFTVSFMITGENENFVKIYIQNEKKEFLLEVYSQSKGTFKVPIKEDGTYFLCIFNGLNEKISFSFDFHDVMDIGKALSIGNNYFNKITSQLYTHS